MLISGILNPGINSLLARVRHTNTLVIADRGFPYFPMIETIDISLVNDVPRVREVLAAVRQNFVAGRVWMAEEFWSANDDATIGEMESALGGIPLEIELHSALKKRVPHAIGLIRTGDTIQYSNLILASA